MGYKDPEKQREYQRKWMAGRRQSWINEHGPCAHCASWDDLQVDHVDPQNKEHNPSALWSLSVCNPVRVRELDKCQVLCFDCHSAKARGESAVGERHGRSKLTAAQVREIRRLCKLRISQRAIADDFGIVQGTVSMIHLRKIWRHI